MKKIAGLICVFILIMGMVPGYIAEAADLSNDVAEATTADLSSVIVSAPAKVPVNGTFTARIGVNLTEAISSFQIQVNYNKDVIEVIGDEDGPEGVTSGLVGQTAVPITLWAFNPPGSYEGSIRFFGGPFILNPLIGTGYLAEIHFFVKGNIGQTSNIIPTDDNTHPMPFINGLFDVEGQRISTVTPWSWCSIQVYQPLQVSTQSLAEGYINNPYSYNMAASGGTPPYTWNASGMPGGLAITAGGQLSGTPTSYGTFNVNFSVTDSATPPVTENKVLELTIYSGLVISDSSLPEATQGAKYSFNLTASGGKEPYNWSANGLPQGLAISAQGQISGKPATSGQYQVNLQVQDAFSPVQTAGKTLVMNVFANLQISTALLAQGNAGESYTASVTASGGKPPFTWSASGLPGGLSISSTGDITGIPLNGGDFNVILNVADSASAVNTASKSLTLHINPQFTVTTTSLPEVMVNNVYSAVLSATGGMSPYTWSASGLPPGLQISASGNISGTPAQAGDYNVVFTVKDSRNPQHECNSTLTLHVYNVISIATQQLNARRGYAYSGKLTAAGGKPGYTWIITGLPEGFSATSDGKISGTGAILGIYQVNVSLTDSYQPANTTAGTIILKVYLAGDANLDQKISILDVTKCERMILGLTPPVVEADANGDTKLNIADVTKLERIILGLP